jgi:hypothetical protein
MRPAIVTTLKLPEGKSQPLDSFLRYHLRVGFDHVFLFFDDATDSSAEVAAVFPPEKVTVIRRDASHKEREKQCKLYADLADCLESEVQARQQLNCEIAMEMANDMGLTWLVHIDMDEVRPRLQTTERVP